MLGKPNLTASKWEDTAPEEEIEDSTRHSFRKPNERLSRQPRHRAEAEHSFTRNIEDAPNRFAKRLEENLVHINFVCKRQEGITSSHSKNDGRF